MAGIRVAHVKGNGRYALLRFAEQSSGEIHQRDGAFSRNRSLGGYANWSLFRW
jgi:hypothetical protein